MAVNNIKPDLAERACILVVDDNEMNRDLLSRRLERQGHEVMTAENGRLALDMVAEHCFDLILLDIMMPVMNGFEVLQTLKQHPKWQYIPVLVVSAADDMTSIVRGIELGAEDYLTKPINAMLLKARIRASLEKKRLYDKEQARMAEMATMQQIDAELNATLDLRRIMEMTLEWAMSHANSDAGLMGIIVDEQVYALASAGYSYEINVDMPQYLLPDELPAVKQLFDWGKMAYIGDTRGAGLLARAQSQIAIPIRREEKLIALLLLESTEPHRWDNTETLAFLTRLCAHAAIAIANAQLYEVVQSANKAKTEFVSFVSHELKTPMTTIQGYTDWLLSGKFGDINSQQAQFLGTVQANVDRMKRLVSDLEDISRIESGHLHLEPAAVPIEELIDEVLQSTRRQIQEKSQKLDILISENLPPVWGDRVRLVQILTNLVTNSHKYTPPEGDITIRANLTVEMDDHQIPRKMVHIAVEDNGVGIHEDEQESIFGKFFRSSDELTQGSPGTGLGLNITKNLVEMHNGRIWFESIYRQGSTFHILRPATTEQEKETAVAPPNHPSRNGHVWSAID